MDELTADILVVGGGTGATAAAIQAARYREDIQVVLVSKLPWLGGMLTAAGVSAPDGNELASFQTGLWGEFLKELERRHPEGLDKGWVSFFTYNPAVGAQIFVDWVDELPNLIWISDERSHSVLKQGQRITGVRFQNVTVRAQITLDGTELGDLLALGEVPYRWGWETQSVWNEPSAPTSLTDPADPLYEITQRYPVQSPTWVVVMKDYGEQKAPKILPPPSLLERESFDDYCSKHFAGAWANYGDDETSPGQTCLNYGRLPGDLFMINWPHKGNDYGVGLSRLIESEEARTQYGREAQQHSRAFARFIQQELGDRYGLASDLFPKTPYSPGGGFALMPYYRESRRLIGLTTVSERDILPAMGTQRADLPIDESGEMDAIALGNYPNDHHYPSFEMPLAPKAIRWGGRWTGTPFTIPYRALVPKKIDGLLVCEKNISVSHIANGATRLQPVVFGIGQAAGMAAALCIEKKCDPRALPVKQLQKALILDARAPAAVVPLFNLPPEYLDWTRVQQAYLANPAQYAKDGNHSWISTRPTYQKNNQEDGKQPGQCVEEVAEGKQGSYALSSLTWDLVDLRKLENAQTLLIKGTFRKDEEGVYQLHQHTDKNLPDFLILLTIRSEITETFVNLESEQQVYVLGTWNASGKWLLCQALARV